MEDSKAKIDPARPTQLTNPTDVAHSKSTDLILWLTTAEQDK